MGTHVKQEKIYPPVPTLEENPSQGAKSETTTSRTVFLDTSTNTMINSNDFATLEEYNSALEAQVEKGNQGYNQCRICEYSSKQKHHVKEHIESQHFKVSFSCPQCSQCYKNRSGLRLHKKSHL